MAKEQKQKKSSPETQAERGSAGPSKTKGFSREEKKTKAFIEVGETNFPAQIMEITDNMGTREGGRQVRVKVLAGKDEGKIIRRNVLGPIKIGDVLMLRETEIEASPIRGRKR